MEQTPSSIGLGLDGDFMTSGSGAMSDVTRLCVFTISVSPEGIGF
jgi:hypothetical protein